VDTTLRASIGQSLEAYLGHKNIPHTVRYTELSPTRFKHFWRNRDVRNGLAGLPSSRLGFSRGDL